MSPRHALFFTVVFFILTPYYFLVDRPVPITADVIQKQESLLNLSDVDAITVSRAGESLRFEKTADRKRYQIVQPQGAFIPQDLMVATEQLLRGAKSVDVIAENPTDLSQYGLDKPELVMTIDAPGHEKPIKISFGSENPTHTAIYAQIEGVPKVILLGRNLEYYQTLMFQWIEGKQGKNA